MNNFKKFVGHILRNLYSNYKIDFLEEYKKVKKLELPQIRGSNIVIAPFTFDNTHIFEAIYARKAMLEGINVYAFLCGQGVNYCEKKGKGIKLKNIKCEICVQTQYDFVNQFGVKSCFVERELTNQDKALITKYISDYFSENNSPSFMGVNVKKVLFSALQRYYFEAEPTMINNKITRGFLETILSTLIVLDRLCMRVNPEYVLVSHGTYSSWGSIVEYCKAKKIPVVVWGRVYNEWGIYFANNESYITEMVTGSNDEWINMELTNKQKKLALDYLQMRTGEDKVEFVYDYNKNQKRQLSREEICTKLNISPEANIVGMFPNIPWDGSASGVSEAFSSYRDWLSTTIDFFRDKKDIFLLIRTHPAEKAADAEIGRETLRSLINQMYSALPDNIIVLAADSEINSFAIGKASIYGIYYCSTVGMELTYLGVPLICAGPSPLRNKEIVYDAQNREQYIEFLETGIRKELSVSDKMKQNLLRFCYYNNFRRVMPETFVKVENGTFNRLLFDNEKEIKESEILHYLFQTIEKYGKYNFDNFYS